MGFQSMYAPLPLPLRILYSTGPAQQLRIQLNAVEQAVVDRRYLSPSDADDAAADIDRLMTSSSSSCHVTATPTSGGSGPRGVVSAASDSDLVRGASKSPATDLDHAGSADIRPRSVMMKIFVHHKW